MTLLTHYQTLCQIQTLITETDCTVLKQWLCRHIQLTHTDTRTLMHADTYNITLHHSMTLQNVSFKWQLVEQLWVGPLSSLCSAGLPHGSSLTGLAPPWAGAVIEESSSFSACYLAQTRLSTVIFNVLCFLFTVLYSCSMWHSVVNTFDLWSFIKDNFPFKRCSAQFKLAHLK